MQDSQQPVTSNTHFKIAKKNSSSEAALSVCQPLTNKKRQRTWDRAIVLISIIE